MIERKKIQYILENYKPKNGQGRKMQKKSIEEELDEILRSEDIVQISKKKIDEVVEKYFEKKQDDLSLEAKASLQMVQSNKELEEISKKGDELLKRDLDDMKLNVTYEEKAGIFKSLFLVIDRRGR